MKTDPARFTSPAEFTEILGHAGPIPDDLKVKYYDFRRPDKFSKDQIRTFAIMHETFARLDTTTLSAILRTVAHVHVAGVDQLTYEEFIRSLDNPTFLSIVNMDPLKGSAVLQIDPALTFAVVERLFGGRARNSVVNRDLTDIEASVMEEVVLRLFGNLREAWSTIIDLRPRLGQIETNPLFAQIVPPTEMVIVVTFEAVVGEARGNLNLCVPYLTIEPIIPKLSAQYWYSLVRQEGGRVTRDTSGLKAGALIRFDAERLSLADVFQLKRNSLVKLADPSTAFLDVGGATVCRFDAKREKGGYAFAVAAGSGGAAEELLPGADSRPDKTADIGDMVRAPLEKLAADLRGAVDGLAGRIAAVQKRQEELADQLFQNGRSRDDAAPAAGPGGGRPFAFIGPEDLDALFNLIQLEHPQTAALVMSFLDPGSAAGLLARLPEEAQADIAERIALMDRCHPEVIRAVEKVLEKRLVRVGREKAFLQETDAIIGILNVTGRTVEKNIIGRLEKTNPELAEQIKRKLFVFEDTVLLDDKAIKLLLPRIDPADLLLALKAVNEKTREKFLMNMKPDAREKFAVETQAVGPVRLADADKAQQRIIGLLRRMEEAGEIVVAHPDELVPP